MYAFCCVALEDHLSPCHRLLFSPLSILPRMHFIVLPLKTAPLLSSPFVLLSFVNVTAYAFRCVALEGHHLSPCHRLLFSPLSMLPHMHFVMLHLEITSLLIIASCSLLCRYYHVHCVALEDHHLSPRLRLCRYYQMHIHYHVCIWLCCPRSPFSLFSPLSIIIMFVVLSLKTTSLLVIVFCSLICECYHISFRCVLHLKNPLFLGKASPILNIVITISSLIPFSKRGLNIHTLV